MSERITTFREFWPYYVGQHRNATCRALHFVGTSSYLACVAALLYTHVLWFLPLALLTSYGPAWVGHFFFEHNRPATFKYPFYSLAADHVMYGKMWLGQMGAELQKAEAAT